MIFLVEPIEMAQRISLAALACVTLVVACTQPLPLPFVDHAVLCSPLSNLTLRVNEPVKGPRVIMPDKPWESWAVFAYNHVMEVYSVFLP